MADSDAVDDAVIAKLTEPTLAGFMPDGVHYDVAPGGSKFVIVSLLAHDDQYMFGGVAFERFVYLVEARQRATVPTGAIRSAARRIHFLLQSKVPFVPLVIEGYVHTKTERIERVKLVEVDDIDPNIRWQRQGGQYEVLVTPV